MRITNENNKDRSTKIELDAKDIDNATGGASGIEISVRGFKANRQDYEQVQIFIEEYDGKTQIHIWNDTNDPVTFVLTREKEENPKTRGAGFWDFKVVGTIKNGPLIFKNLQTGEQYVSEETLEEFGPEYLSTEEKKLLEENIHCKKCLSKELPLHTDGLCPDCHE